MHYEKGNLRERADRRYGRITRIVYLLTQPTLLHPDTPGRNLPGKHTLKKKEKKREKKREPEKTEKYLVRSDSLHISKVIVRYLILKYILQSGTDGRFYAQATGTPNEIKYSWFSGNTM